MNHSIGQKIKKIAAYSVITSQLLTSTHQLVAMEALSNAFASPHKVAPSDIEMTTPSNESGNKIVPEETLNVLPKDNAEELENIPDNVSVDSDIQNRASDEDLKKFNTFLDNNLRYDFSKKDYALFAGVLIGTALLGYGIGLDNMGEILGEVRMWIDNVFFTFAQTVEGYRFIYMNRENNYFYNQLEKVQEWNSYLFLTPYVATRLYAMANYADSCVSTNLPTAYNSRFLKGLLYTGAILGGANVGGSLASQYYSNNIAFAENSKVYAKFLTPYILTFYCLDAILTYSQMIQNIVIPELVKRSESEENHLLRKKLSLKLEKTKEILASMNDEEILKVNIVPSVDEEQANQENVGIQKFQNLLDLSNKKIQHRRYSMHASKPKSHRQSIVGFLKRKWHYLLSAGIVGAGGFLTFKTNYTNASAFLNTKFSWDFNPNQFDSMGSAAFQAFSLSAYTVWKKDTQHVEIYNGNGTDWCSQCFNSAKFTIGNQSEGGELYFMNCPGVSFTQGLTANPGDLDYGDEMCNIWFNIFDHYLAYKAGIETDDYYAPLETEINLDSTQYGFANFLAVCGTVASGLFAIKALDESFKRISDSFSDTPQDILPGKKNKYVNAVVIPLSMIQAVNRSAGNAMLAWVLMQEYNIHPALQWSVVASSTFTSSMGYFMNFDDAYSQLPGNLISIYTQGKNVIFSQLNADYVPTQSAYVQCETLIKKANTMQDAVAVANIDVFKEVA